MENIVLNDVQMRLYKTHQENNEHTENLILLAAVSGNEDLLYRALQLFKLREKRGGIDDVLRPMRDYLEDNLKVANYHESNNF